MRSMNVSGSATSRWPTSACQGLDLRERSWRLFEADVREAFFLGCQLEGSALEYLNGQGACVFPAIDGLPFRSFRGDLYDAAELYAGYVPGDHESYEVTPDARSYREHKRTAASLHVVGDAGRADSRSRSGQCPASASCSAWGPSQWWRSWAATAWLVPTMRTSKSHG